MQFSLRTLFIFVSLSAVFCGIVFSLPIAGSIIVLTLLTSLLPALVTGGIIYGRNAVRAFWIGSAVTGLIPSIVAIFSGYMVCIEMLFNRPPLSRVDEDMRWIVGIITACFLLIFFSGGAIVIAVRWLCLDKKHGKVTGKTSDALPKASSILHRRISSAQQREEEREN